MLFHVSIDARAPRRVAEVLTELFGGGVATVFPPVAEGSWIALAGDDRGTAIEVYPRGTGLVETPGDADAGCVMGEGGRSATHFAMASPLDRTCVEAIAHREGWPAKYRRRGGVFGVIELWIEGDRMVEVLTPEMQAEYAAGMAIRNWIGMAREMELVAEAA